MVRYIKDGAYTIVVDDTIVEGSTEGESGNSDGDKNNIQEEECMKEIDYTSISFILQNLKLATPSYSDDKTFMLTGRKELIEIICSQVRYYCYCALLALDSKTIPVSILIIGDGFVSSNIITSLVDHGLSSMLRIFARSETSATEWSYKGLKAGSSIMPLLGGQRPDIIIPCVQNASFSAICKQLTELTVVTDTTFIITPTFGFQRRKLYHGLKCSNIFRTFVEPQRIVRKYKSSKLAKRVELLALLAAGPDEDSGDEAVGKKTRDSAIAQSVAWGGDLRVSVDEGDLKTGVSGVAGAVQSSLDKVNKDRELLSSQEEGAVLVRERAGDPMNLVFLLENYYFLHGMLHHEARKTAMDAVFGFHEGHTHNSSFHSAAQSRDGHGSHNDSASHRSDDLESASPSVHSASQHSATHAPLSPLQQMHMANSFLSNVSSPPETPAGGKSLHQYTHVHPIYKHNVMRRQKVSTRVRHALERAIDTLYESDGCVYHAEFCRGSSEEELAQSLLYYPVNHQHLLDLQSFENNKSAMTSFTTPDGKHVVPKQDKHSRFMYDEQFLNELFALDDDVSDLQGPGFDFIRQLDAKSSTPKRSSRPGTADTAETADTAREGEDLSELMRLMQEAAQKQQEEKAREESKPKKIRETMGERMFRKHSTFAVADNHGKLPADILDDGVFLEAIAETPSNKNFSQIMSDALSKQKPGSGDAK